MPGHFLYISQVFYFIFKGWTADTIIAGLFLRKLLSLLKMLGLFIMKPKFFSALKCAAFRCFSCIVNNPGIIKILPEIFLNSVVFRKSSLIAGEGNNQYVAVHACKQLLQFFFGGFNRKVEIIKITSV